MSILELRELVSMSTSCDLLGHFVVLSIFLFTMTMIGEGDVPDAETLVEDSVSTHTLKWVAWWFELKEIHAEIFNEKLWTL